MKLIYFSIYFFIINSSLLLGQIKFANVIGKQKYEYGILGNSVFKLDSLGNSIWVKDFSGFLVPSTYPNELIGSAFDGNYLYVAEIQGMTLGDLSIHTSYGAVIKMDTLGNILFIIIDSVRTTYRLKDIYPLITGGAWLFDDYAPGHTHVSRAQLIYSNGNLGAVVDFWYGSVTFPWDFHILPDSNYIACVHNDQSLLTYPFPALTKFTQSGSIAWRKDYFLTSSPLEEVAMEIDSADNIYLLCAAFPGTLGIKINSINGNVLASRYWSELNPFSITSFNFGNGKLTCTLGGSEIYFDTLLFNSCFNDQNVSVSVGNSYISQLIPQMYSGTTFTPSNGAPISYQSQTYLDYCAVLSINDNIPKARSFEVFPNPAMSKISIRTNNQSIKEIIISDLFGKIYLKSEMGGNEMNLNVDKLNSGIYIIRITSETISVAETLVVER